MKRMRYDSATPHQEQNMPPPPTALKQRPNTQPPLLRGPKEADRLASLPTGQRTQAETPVQEPAERCPCIRAYSVSLMRLPGGALRVAFFEGEGVKPRGAQRRHV